MSDDHHCEPPRAEAKWVGRTIDEISADLGEPTSTYLFTLGAVYLVGEREVLEPQKKLLPDGDAQDITEVVWKDRDCRLKVWFAEIEGQSTSIDNLFYSKYAEF